MSGPHCHQTFRQPPSLRWIHCTNCTNPLIIATAPNTSTSTAMTVTIDTPFCVLTRSFWSGPSGRGRKEVIELELRVQRYNRTVYVRPLAQKRLGRAFVIEHSYRCRRLVVDNRVHSASFPSGLIALRGRPSGRPRTGINYARTLFTFGWTASAHLSSAAATGTVTAEAMYA